jgi:hypothetical protein
MNDQERKIKELEKRLSAELSAVVRRDPELQALIRRAGKRNPKRRPAERKWTSRPADPKQLTFLL